MNRFVHALVPPLLIPVAVVVATLAANTPAQGQLTSTNLAPVIYRLTPQASLTRGCFPPCLCPVVFFGPVRGTMILTPIPTSPTATIFDYRVDDVNWLAAINNSNEWRITGTGILRRVGAPSIGAQRLELDLRINDESVAHFDSGWHLPSVPFPSLDLGVSLNGGVCFDTVIRVAAAPVPTSQVLRYRVTQPSTWQTGCWPPCMCPLQMPRPVTGPFTLVPIPAINPTPTAPIEYAVVNVVFNVLSPSTTVTDVSIRYRGYGFYRRNLPSPTSTTPNHQRLFLDLRRVGLNTTAGYERFDSGIVPTTMPFPVIDILISKNGMVCLDTVFDLRASPITTTP